LKVRRDAVANICPQRPNRRFSVYLVDLVNLVNLVILVILVNAYSQVSTFELNSGERAIDRTAIVGAPAATESGNGAWMIIVSLLTADHCQLSIFPVR
jgi:hypothetical protein